jgi:hypothetical protein
VRLHIKDENQNYDETKQARVFKRRYGHNDAFGLAYSIDVDRKDEISPDLILSGQ